VTVCDGWVVGCGRGGRVRGPSREVRVKPPSEVPMNKRLNNFVDVVVRIDPVLSALDSVRIKLDMQQWSDLLDVPGVEALIDAIMDLDREVNRTL
jgi:hypothetical protein